MSELTFNSDDEARAWDLYVAAFIATPSPINECMQASDLLILERRKRSNPESTYGEWIPHKPGDPMPCDPNLVVHVRFSGGGYNTLELRASMFNWLDVEAWKKAP